MKKLLSLITAALLFCGLSISAPAQSVYEYLHGVAWTQIEPLPTSEDISIPGTITITKNTTFTDKDIIIETGGILEIKNGASLTLQSTCIVVGRGGSVMMGAGARSGYGKRRHNKDN